MGRGEQVSRDDSEESSDSDCSASSDDASYSSDDSASSGYSYSASGSTPGTQAPSGGLGLAFLIGGVVAVFALFNLNTVRPNAERAHLEAEHARAEQQRVAVAIQNSKINSPQPIATFKVVLGGFSFLNGKKPEVGQVVVWNTGLQYPDEIYQWEKYLWFGHFFDIAKQVNRQTRTEAGFTIDDYPTVTIRIRSGKDGSYPPVMVTYKGPVFEDDETRDRFYATVVDSFNKWRSQFPEAY